MVSYRRIYILALSIVALCSFGSLWIIHSALERMESDASVVNVAGRQRMLSQRIALLHDGGGGEQDLNVLIKLMASSNQELLDPSRDSMARRLLGREVLADHAGLYSQVSLFLSRARAVDDEARAAELRVAANELLPRLDDFVHVVERASKAGLEELDHTELALFLFVAVILLLEGLLIFNPMARSLVRAFNAVESERAAVEARERLSLLVFDNMDEGLVLVDDQGRATTVRSRRFEEWFGDVEPGARLAEIIPELPERDEGFRVERGARWYEGRVMSLRDERERQLRIVMLADETEVRAMNLELGSEVERMLPYLVSYPEHYAHLRAELKALLGQVIVRREGDRGPVELLLSALGRMGFEVCTRGCRRLLKEDNLRAAHEAIVADVTRQLELLDAAFEAKRGSSRAS